MDSEERAGINGLGGRLGKRGGVEAEYLILMGFSGLCRGYGSKHRREHSQLHEGSWTDTC